MIAKEGQTWVLSMKNLMVENVPSWLKRYPEPCLLRIANDAHRSEVLQPILNLQSLFSTDLRLISSYNIPDNPDGQEMALMYRILAKQKCLSLTISKCFFFLFFLSLLCYGEHHFDFFFKHFKILKSIPYFNLLWRNVMELPLQPVPVQAVKQIPYSTTNPESDRK